MDLNKDDILCYFNFVNNTSIKNIDYIILPPNLILVIIDKDTLLTLINNLKFIFNISDVLNYIRIKKIKNIYNIN